MQIRQSYRYGFTTAEKTELWYRCQPRKIARISHLDAAVQLKCVNRGNDAELSGQSRQRDRISCPLSLPGPYLKIPNHDDVTGPQIAASYRSGIDYRSVKAV